MEPENYVNQTFWTDQNIRTSSIAERIVKCFAARDDEFKTHMWYGGSSTNRRNIKFNDSDIPRIIDTLIKYDGFNDNYMVFTNRDNKKREIIFGFTISTLKRFSLVTFQVTSNFFLLDNSITRYLNIAKDIIGIIKPVYGMIHDVKDNVEVKYKKNQVIDVFREIPGGFWGNYFGEYYLDRLGKDKLLAFQGYQVEMVNDGVLILTSPSPLTFSSREDRKMQRKLENYLGI